VEWGVKLYSNQPTGLLHTTLILNVNTLFVLLTLFIDCFVVCVMYVKQFASEEWREARY